ncbi:MAG: spore coat protein, partial [Hyphomicrobiales bacterium]
YAIALSNGGGAGATDTLRQMTSGANTIDYMIYQDVENTLPWSPTATLAVAAAAEAGETFTAYGTVSAGQIVPTGTYADSVIATITY